MRWDELEFIKAMQTLGFNETAQKLGEAHQAIDVAILLFQESVAEEMRGSIDE